MLASIRTLGAYLSISVCFLGAGIALAQTADKPIEISIPAGNLADALEKLGNQAGLQIMYEPEVAKGIRVAAVSGTLTANDALTQLLAQTGLKADRVNEKTVVLRKAEAEKKPQPAKSGKDRPSTENRPSQEPSEDLQEIVVTAQKREERLKDVPISISVVSGEALDKSTSQGVSDELNRVPGVVIPPPSQNGVSQISIRGVGASFIQWAGASPVAYYLDTVPFGFVRSAYIPDTGMFDLARVEVLRGPQGTLYGASAEDGVVRIIPNEADPNGFDLKARALGSSTYSGGGNWGGDLAVNVPLIEGQLAVRGVIDYQNLSGWIDRQTEKNANDAQLRNYRVKIAYLPTAALSIDLSLWSSRDHFGAPSDSGPNRTTLNSGTTPEPIENDFDAYGAKISYQFSKFTVTSMTSYFDFRTSNDINLTPYGGFYEGLSLHNLASSDVFSEEVLVNSIGTGPWRLTGGAFYRGERDVNGQLAEPGDLGRVDFNDKSRSSAFFGQVGRRFLNEKLEWTLGVRQFHDNVSTVSTDPTVPPSYLSESFNAITPRAVISWYPSEKLTAYASFSEGFRSGMPLYYAVTEIAPSLPAVKPDKLYNYELGTKADLFDHHLTIDAAVYYVKWRDVQQSIVVPLPGGGLLNTQVNGSSASGPGVDLAITMHLTDGVRLGGTFSWNGLSIDSPVVSAGQVLFNTGDRLNNSSEYTGSLFATYSFPLGSRASGELSVSGNYTSKQAIHGIDGNELAYVNYGDDLFFAQAALTATFEKNWSLKVYGDNLTNQYGAVYGPPVGYGPNQGEFVPRPRPRTIGLEVDYRFR